MKIRIETALILAVLVSQVVRVAGSPGFTSIGTFSNMEFSEEHQYGSEVQLWRAGAEVVGLFSYSEGLIGDTPTGLIEDTRYDPRTGRLSFKAKVTTGQHFCKAHNDLPSQDLFSFQGVLSKLTISGILKRFDVRHPENSPTEEKVVLKKMSARQTEYQSRKEWEEASREILKSRGPKW